MQYGCIDFLTSLGLINGAYWIGLRQTNWGITPWRWSNGLIVDQGQTAWNSGMKNYFVIILYLPNF